MNPVSYRSSTEGGSWKTNISSRHNPLARGPQCEGSNGPHGNGGIIGRFEKNSRRFRHLAALVVQVFAAMAFVVFLSSGQRTSGILRSGFGESSASSALPTLLTGVCSSIWNYLSTHINEIATAHLLAVCAGLCISAGSGGGGLFVPILIAMVGMEVHTATSASQILIFGSSMAGVCYDLTQRHPERERPLIDLSVILFLAPVMMAGALVGSVVSTTMPPSLVMLLLVIACSAAAYKSLRKGFRLWQTENQMDIDVMDTMEPINPIALLTCASGDAVAGTPSPGQRTPWEGSSSRPEKLDNEFPTHDHVNPRGLREEDMKLEIQIEDASDGKKLGTYPLVPYGPNLKDNGAQLLASDMIYYKKLRDLRKRKGCNKPFEVLGMHRISFWNPKCTCVFSTFRDQDFIDVFVFLSKKELFSCRAVCLRWHFLSHAQKLQKHFGDLKRTVSYSVIWNPETPTQTRAPPPLVLRKIKEEPLMLGEGVAMEIEDIEPSPLQQRGGKSTALNSGDRAKTMAMFLCEPCEDTPLKSSSAAKSASPTAVDTASFDRAPTNGSLAPPLPSAAAAARKRGGGMAMRGYGATASTSSTSNSSGGKNKIDSVSSSGGISSKGDRELYSLLGQEVEVALSDALTKGGSKSLSLLSKQQQMITQAREMSRRILLAEQKISPTQGIKLLAIWAITFLLIVVRGGKGTKSVLRVEYCGEVYWVVTFSAIIMLLGVAFFSAKDLFSMHQHKIACHYPFAKGDPHWNMSYLRRMCFITFGTGIAAGVLGVGGGMFLSPVLFELGMLPMVVAAISTSCILLSSSVLTVLIIVQGTVGLSTVFLYFLGTVAGAFLGKFFVKQIVAKYRSSAIIPLILGGVIIASMFVATYQNANKFIRQWGDGEIEGFRAICQASK
mmetsp:Transcript_25868/g.41612  ORF Transcript_25868/g.41612 Transcript_25868/m.41612 type:complete len:895 (-) Transcript_25868:272-2956(-)